MRRNDREITDKARIDEIIRGCHCCRLGFCDGGEVYIVPLNFGFVPAEGGGTLYFHGAKAGRKHQLLQESPMVSFELDREYWLTGGEEACDYACHFQCVMGTGVASIITEEAEKLVGLRALMEQAVAHHHAHPPVRLTHSARPTTESTPPAQSGTIHPAGTTWTFQPEMLAATCVFKVEIAQLSCKEHE